MKHKTVVKATLKLEEVSDNDVFVCKTFSHLVLFEIFAVGNMNVEIAERLKGCRSHAGRMCFADVPVAARYSEPGREEKGDSGKRILMLTQVFSFLTVKSRGT